jgi:4-hydroxybenzoate polyprenyltransferase
MSEADLSVLQRLWIYQRERIPLGKTAVLLAVFSAASINVSAQLAGRALPDWGAYAVAFVVGLIFFFQLRACDEVKDADDDRRYRPERPVPRGLVTLKLIVGLALAAVPLAVVVTALRDPWLLLPLALTWVWMALMAVEFLAPHWLKAHPFVYLVSHMLIMPLIDLFVTATEWLARAGSPPAGLWLFLLLSFANGCVLEIGRKIYAPESERPGVETYSALLGPRHATMLWSAALVAAFALLVAVGFAIGSPRLVGSVGLVALAACLFGAWTFLRAPGARAQKQLDTLSGLWVLICYGVAGFGHLLLRWI